MSVNAINTPSFFIRNTYRKVKRRTKAPSGSGRDDVVKPTLLWFESLTFLGCNDLKMGNASENLLSTDKGQEDQESTMSAGENKKDDPLSGHGCK